MIYEKPTITVYDEETLAAIEAQASSCCPTGKTNN